MPSPIALKKILSTSIAMMFLFFTYVNMNFKSAQNRSEQFATDRDRDTDIGRGRDRDRDTKNIFLQPSSEILVRTHKLLPPIEVSLANQNPEEEYAPNAPFTLLAKIRTLKPTNTIAYKWIIPEGVTQLFGGNSSNPQGTLNNVSPKQDQILTTTFISSSEVNEKIHLRVTLETNGMAQTAQYNTREQKNIDAAMADLAERNREYIIENASER